MMMDTENTQPESQDQAPSPDSGEKAEAADRHQTAAGAAPPPAPPPHWTAWLPPDMEIRPRKRRRLGGCLLALFILGFLAVLVVLLPAILAPMHDLPVFSGSTAPPPQVREQYIGGDPQAEAIVAVVDIKGVIMSSERMDAASVPRVTAALKHAAARPEVVAVILDMNTPGGEVTASDEIHNAVQHLRRAGKPVITCMRSMAASGGYYIAAGTDYIVANRLTLTGSIGVLMSSINYSELLDKIGVQAQVYTSGEMKALFNGAVERSPQEKELKERFMQTLVDRTFMEFAAIVAEGRGFSSPQAVREATFGDGRVLSGEQALDFGLVDKLGYFSDAVAKAMEIGTVQRAKVIRLQRHVPMIDRVLGMRAAAGALPESVVPAEIRALEPGRLYYLMLPPDHTPAQ